MYCLAPEGSPSVQVGKVNAGGWMFYVLTEVWSEMPALSMIIFIIYWAVSCRHVIRVSKWEFG